jgi:hypothetical protein
LVNWRDLVGNDEDEYLAFGTTCDEPGAAMLRRVSLLWKTA